MQTSSDEIRIKLDEFTKAGFIFSDEHRYYTEVTIDSSLQFIDLFESTAIRAKKAVGAAGFATLCAPPGTQSRDVRLAARFLMFYNKLEDMAAEDLDAIGMTEKGIFGPYNGLSAAIGYYDSLRTDMLKKCGDVSVLDEAVRDLALAMTRERRSDKATISEDECRSLREITIAVKAYVACWCVIRGIPFDPNDEALKVACELIYLTNDVASLERDEEDSRRDASRADLNTVLVRARSYGKDEAIKAIVERHNRLIQRMRALLSSGTTEYLELLRRCVVGNMDVTLKFADVYYPGAPARLTSLHQLT